MTCKDCIHSGLCYKENDYENFPDRCGRFISDKVLEERPQGRWVEIERQSRTGDGRVFTFPIIVCSNCGEQYDLEGEKFCPHCGADMRGRE